jgi:hypothetical protein
MKMSAKRGLALHAEGESGDGLKPATVADARKMVEGTALSEDKWRRIAPWIARHIGDLDAVQGNEVTPGLVAMLLWGGGSSKSSARRAQAYAERIVAQLDAEKRYDPDQPREEDGKFGEGVGGGGSDDVSDKNIIGTNKSEVELDPDIEDMAGSEEYSQIVDGILADEQGEYGDGLVPAQREALDYYTGVGHRPINKTLRGAPPPPPSPEQAERSRAEAERINGAIRAAPALEESVIVYRGISDSAELKFNEARVGATYVDKGIVSTSLSLDTAQGFSGQDKSDVPNTLLEIRVPSGSNALSVSAFKGREWMERELMLPSETKFTVVGKKKLETGQIVVIVDANTGN